MRLSDHLKMATFYLLSHKLCSGFMADKNNEGLKQMLAAISISWWYWGHEYYVSFC